MTEKHTYEKLKSILENLDIKKYPEKLWGN